MEQPRVLCRRHITFRCGAKVIIVGLTEADLDEEQARYEQQDCFHCRIEDGVITDDEIDMLAASILFSLNVMQAERVSQSKVN